jgi:hypothetical protein
MPGSGTGEGHDPAEPACPLFAVRAALTAIRNAGRCAMERAAVRAGRAILTPGSRAIRLQRRQIGPVAAKGIVPSIGQDGTELSERETHTSIRRRNGCVGRVGLSFGWAETKI